VQDAHRQVLAEPLQSHRQEVTVGLPVVEQPPPTADQQAWVPELNLSRCVQQLFWSCGAASARWRPPGRQRRGRR